MLSAGGDEGMSATGTKKKKVMSVREMGELLGIGKSDRYWLLKKGYFKIIHVAGKMWVETESFEKWYAGQTRYHKVTGEEPGKELAARTFSVREMADLLKISDSTAYEIIRRDRISFFWESGMMRIVRKDFWIWYDCQIRYHAAASDQPDIKRPEYHFSIPEMADILDISTKEAYRLIEEPACASSLAISLIGDRMYVSWESFGRFLRKQEKYCYNPGKDPSIVKTGGSVFLNIRQACWYAKVSKPTIINWCRQGSFPVKRAGKNVRIPLNEFDRWMKKRKEEKNKQWHQ